MRRVMLPFKRDAYLSAHTEKLGFLNLPNQVRYRIYELAIYDFDRGAVFLPRGVPRKVTPETDVDVVEITEVDSKASVFINPDDDAVHVMEMANPFDATRAGGDWTYGETVANSADMVNEILRDGEASEAYHDGSEDLSPPGTFGARETSIGEEASIQLEPCFCEACDCLLCSYCQGVVGELVECYCRCHEAHEAGHGQDLGECSLAGRCKCLSDDGPWRTGVTSVARISSTVPHLSSGLQGVDDSETEGLNQFTSDAVRPPDICLQRYCQDGACEHCAGHGLGSSEDEDAYAVEDHPWEKDDYLDEDDEEHFDSEEKIGMLYEPKDPPILLASKEIRTHCLPLYYALNSFSWRFLWLDLPRSADRFESWVKSVTDSQVALIRRISFESRHQSAEGIEFSVDIDLLKQRPFFSLKVSASHTVDVETERIVQELDRTVSRQLSDLSSSGRVKIMLSMDRLLALSSTFIKAMRS